MTHGDSEPWVTRIHDSIAALGHRNWIVIADAAYPAHASQDIEAALIPNGQVEVLRMVLRCLDQVPHLRVKAYTDLELSYVAEEQAPGITEHRCALGKVLSAIPRTNLIHEELINRVDKASQRYRTLVLKTQTALPYSSVFLELDCGYWTDQAEQRLRRTISEQLRAEAGLGLHNGNFLCRWIPAASKNRKGWRSVVSALLSDVLVPVMSPTIFALSIAGLLQRPKASSDIPVVISAEKPLQN